MRGNTGAGPRVMVRPLVGMLVMAAGLVGQAQASVFGINAHVPSTRMVAEARAAGIGWIRIDFIWAYVEVERDVYDWSTYDRLIADAEAGGLKVFASIAYTPEWAAVGDPWIGVPWDPDFWQEFCYEAAARYRGRVHAWGLWNEPNLDNFWQGTRGAYIELILKRGAIAIRAADPDALICAPDLAHLNSGDWDSWLEDVIERAGDYFDVVTHHVYPGGCSHSDVTRDLDRGGGYPWESPSVREVLEDAGWWGKPVWLTETGVETDECSEGPQAGFYESLLGDWFRPDRDLSWVSRIFFYELVDSRNNPNNTWGIIGEAPSFERKNAFYAYRDFISSSAVDDGDVVSTTLPAFAAPGSQIKATITMLNTGTSTWVSGLPYRLLVEVDDPDWEVSVDPRWVSEDVPPGGTATFQVVLVPPLTEAKTPTTSTVSWQMDLRRSWLFGERRSARITVTEESPATITLQPFLWSGPSGVDATFTVACDSDTAPSYEWRRNSLILDEEARFDGVDTSVLTVRDVDLDVAGEYYCVITNAAGSVVSEPARLRLTTGLGDDPRSSGDRVSPVTSRQRARRLAQWLAEAVHHRRQLRAGETRDVAVTLR